MMQVDVFPLSAPGANYGSQVYSGLFRLHARGEIRLGFRFRKGLRPATAPHLSTAAHLVYLEVTKPGGDLRRIWIDLHDSPDLAAPSVLEHSDLYFKRTFDPACLARETGHRPGILAKIKPYGLFQTCRVDEEFGDLRRTLAFLFHTGKLWREPIASTNRIASVLVGSEKTLRLAGRLSEFAFREDAGNTVIFQTRLFDAPSSRFPEDTENLNHLRKDLVLALRGALADRFYGGVISKAGPQSAALASNVPTDREGYLREMSRHAIAVVTRGLDGSIPEKLAEALSMGQCIVLERFAAEAFPALVEGDNVLLFSSPEECVEQCRRLMADAQAREQMRRRNYRVYQDMVSPGPLVRRLLNYPDGL